MIWYLTNLINVFINFSGFFTFIWIVCLDDYFVFKSKWLYYFSQFSFILKLFFCCVFMCVCMPLEAERHPNSNVLSQVLSAFWFFETTSFTGRNMLNKLLWLASKTQGATSQEQHYIAIQQFWFGLYIVSLETIIVLYFEMSVIRYVHF